MLEAVGATTAIVVTLRETCLNDYFEDGLPVSDLVRKYKRSRDTIRDWIQEEHVRGRARNKTTARGPKPNGSKQPLTPLHKKIGAAVYKWRLNSTESTPKSAATFLGYSAFKYSQIENGVCDFTLAEAIEIVKAINSPEILTLCSLT